MLPRAARSPCWRTPKPFIHPARVVARPTPWKNAYYGSQFRIFTSSQNPLRRQVAGDKTAEQKTATTNAPAAANAVQDQKTIQNAKTTKKNDLLSEATVGNKEQRKADWAIMKEMAKYLWPKVRRISSWYRGHTHIDWMLQ